MFSKLFLFTTLTIAVVHADHEIRIVNKCNQPLNIGIRGDNGSPSNGGFRLESNSIRTVFVPQGWTAGRLWGRTGCGGNNCCETGDCGSCRLECAGLTGEPDVTLAEFTLDSNTNGLDFYDISLVDAFNLPMSIEPILGTFQKGYGDSKYNCGAPRCTHDLLQDCPAELREVKNGRTVACLSACTKFRKDEYCCPAGSPFGTPQTCRATVYAKHFKQRCSDAYSYAYDDEKSTYTCKSAVGRSSGYTVTFCPQ